MKRIICRTMANALPVDEVFNIATYYSEMNTFPVVIMPSYNSDGKYDLLRADFCHFDNAQWKILSLQFHKIQNNGNVGYEFDQTELSVVNLKSLPYPLDMYSRVIFDTEEMLVYKHHKSVIGTIIKNRFLARHIAKVNLTFTKTECCAKVSYGDSSDITDHFWNESGDAK